MILKRCPSCRGVADVERSTLCFACGAEIAAAAPALKRKRPPKSMRVVVKDKKRVTVLLICFAVLGGLGVLGIIVSDADPVVRVGLGILFLAGVVLGIQSIRGQETGTLGRAVLKLFAFFGLLIFGVAGLVLLLFIACAVGGIR